MKTFGVRLGDDLAQEIEEEAREAGDSVSEVMRGRLRKEKPPAKFRELGAVGLKRWSGHIREEFLKELRGKKKYRVFKEMSYNDPVIGALLFAVEQIIRSADWTVRPGGDSREEKEAARFVAGCMKDMSIGWEDFISQVLSFLRYGFSIFEIVYKVRKGPEADPPSQYSDGRVGWRKFAFRSQEGVEKWVFDEAGGLEGFEHRAPPGRRLVRIPIWKSLLFRTQTAKGNPEGKSILRNAYRPWYFKRNIEEIEAIGVERDLAGLPVIWLPRGYTKEEDVGSSSDEAIAKRVVSGIRRDEYEGLVLPGPKADSPEAALHGGWLLELLSTGGRRQFDTSEIISRYEQDIAMSVLAEWIMLGVAKAGSYALGKVQSNFFLLALEGWSKSIAGVLNRYALPRLLSPPLNHFEGELPVIVPTPLYKPDLRDMIGLVRLLADLGLEVSDLEEEIRAMGGLPGPPKER